MVIVTLGVQTGRHVALDRLYIMLKPTLFTVTVPKGLAPVYGVETSSPIDREPVPQATRALLGRPAGNVQEPRHSRCTRLSV